MTSRLGRQAGVALTLGALAGGEAVLWRAGRRLPPLSVDPDRLGPTLAEADPLGLAVGVLRLGALAIGAGLIAVTVAGLAARALGAARLVARVNRWTPPSLRRLLDGALGVGLAASIGLSTPAGADPDGGQSQSGTAAATATAAAPSDTPVPSLRRLADGPPAPPDPTTTLRRLPDAAAGASDPTTTTLRRLPDAHRPGGSTTSTAPQVPGAAPVSAEPPPTLGPTPAPAATREVVVRPGDSFWRLAERHQAERLGRQPTDGEVVACWVDLVARNRHRLVVPDDPDLIFPGQVMEIPCP